MIERMSLSDTLISMGFGAVLGFVGAVCFVLLIWYLKDKYTIKIKK